MTDILTSNTVHITIGKGKLEGINSINTSTTTNPFCRKQQLKPNTVCSHCYAKRYEGFRNNIQQAFDRNLFLTKRVIKERETPIINAKYFRFHSYGELHNTLHLENYAMIAHYNPNTTFALWTKRPKLVARAFDPSTRNLPKPCNLILIHSSEELNTVAHFPNQHFDKVFSVFTKEGAKNYADYGLEINCHGNCLSCLKCYDLNNDTPYIKEILK